MPTPAETRVPAAVDAERAVLGAILLCPELLADVLAAGLQNRDFFLDSHRRIYRVLLCMHQRKVPVDLISLCEEMRASGELEAVGSSPYISDLTTGAVPHRKNTLHHAAIVQVKARLRRLQRIGERLQEAAGEHGADPGRLADEATAAIQRAAEVRP